ncbi:hypothetical protein NDU88_008364 [Pleurodeles waltl]|uniref:Uncharacterized protein n=1 Tax=Pleurodeles waltl TaxID=8319 RepID=A0AAV7QNE9_PLEWA|nr:hypothetical protein NDU88_008364 [Pleurodeles waltl]
MIPGAEGRSNDPGKNGTENIGNADERIPISLPGQPTEEDAITIPGNPDIRVSDGIERKDRLRARIASGKEDAKEEGAERGGGTEERPDHKQEEEQKEASSEDNPKGREGPEEPERRHIPGGTWLSQGLRASLFLIDLKLIQGPEGTWLSSNDHEKLSLDMDDLKAYK